MKKFRNYFIYIKPFLAYLIFLILITSCNTGINTKINPSIKKGFIDLSDWKFEQDGTAKIHGEWEFYWDRLLTPEDFKNNNEPDKLSDKLFIQDSRKWNYLTINNKNLNKQGFATYRIKMKIKENNKIMGFKIPLVWTSYNIWINDELFTCGKVGKERKYSKPDTSPKIFFFKPNSSNIEIILQVSNFFDNCGGISSYIIFGTADQIKQIDIKSAAYNFFLVGSMIIISFYHFGLFLLNKKNKIPLYFGVFCLIITTRVLVFGDEFIFLIFPDFNWELSTKLEYITIFMGLPVFILFANKQFQQDFSKYLTYISLVIGLIFSLIVMIFPARIYSNTLIIYQIILITTTLYVIVILIFCIKNKREGAILFTSGLLIFAVTVTNDILHNNEIIKTGYFVPLGLFIFIMAHSFILSLKSSRLYSRAENLSKQLQEYSTELEEKVKQRTIQLEKANKEKTNFFINIAHETKTPLTLISNYLDKFICKYGFSRETGIIKQNIDKLYRDMINYLDAEKFAQNQVIYNHSQIINLSDLLEKKIILFKEISIKKDIIINQDIEKNIYIKADTNALEHIINNLIDNAIKYSFEKGMINISLKTKKDLITFQVKDTGPGIKEEEKENIFLPFYQISNPKSNMQGIGMGLYIVHRIIESLNGEIKVESKINEGSIFSIKLKKYELKAEDSVIDINPYKPVDTISSLKGVTDSQYVKGKKGILLVEDNPDLLIYLVEELSEEYNVFIAKNGNEGLNKLENFKMIDLIISDIMMDQMDGYDFFEKINNDKKYNFIPFIFLTAKSEESHRIKGLSKGAIDYICKPFSINELKAKINTIMNIIKKQKETTINDAIFLLKKEINDPDKLVEEKIKNFENNCNKERLTERQKNIIRLLSSGHEYKEIAKTLNISFKTVDTHIQNLYKKTGMHNKIDLVNYFFK